MAKLSRKQLSSLKKKARKSIDKACPHGIQDATPSMKRKAPKSCKKAIDRFHKYSRRLARMPYADDNDPYHGN